MDYAIFILNNILLGIGLAMDAFSVSLANGLNEPTMPKRKMCAIAGVFALFQGIMPMLGWVCVRTVLQYFRAFEAWIPWIAFVLLGLIGGKMIVEGIRSKGSEEKPKVGIRALLLQGVATSIDALSVGFTIAEYGIGLAFASASIVAAVTFGICILGVFIGKKFGTELSDKATVVGGIILAAIGVEILLTGIL